MLGIHCVVSFVPAHGDTVIHKTNLPIQSLHSNWGLGGQTKANENITTSDKSITEIENNVMREKKKKKALIGLLVGQGRPVQGSDILTAF